MWYDLSMRFALCVVLALTACKHERSLLDESSSAPKGAKPQAETPPRPDELAGTVVETMDSGGYTYARLERTGGTPVWVAGPETKLAVGTKVGRMDGSLMQNFRSDTLKRTFDQIYFVNGFPVGGAAPATADPHAQTGAATAPATDDGELSGVVLETMDSGGYTYAQLDHNGTKVWVAGPETKLAVGSQLGKMTGSLMTNFHSDTLKRTFDQIYFINSFSIAAGAIPNPHTANAAPKPSEPMEKIAPAKGGTTVADVFANKATLSGKPVVVRGKVVKLNNGILGRNWLHLRDGTGAAGTDDLLVTSDATAKLGDIVVARGTVALDQDFGSGYKYAVIVEKATLTAE
jgi:hypothetical protein